MSAVERDRNQRERRPPRHRGDITQIDRKRLAANLFRRCRGDGEMCPLHQHVDGDEAVIGRRNSDRSRIVPNTERDGIVTTRLSADPIDVIEFTTID